LNTDEEKTVDKALEDTRCLPVLIANKSEAIQPEIAEALGVTDRSVRRRLNRKEEKNDRA